MAEARDRRVGRLDRRASRDDASFGVLKSGVTPAFFKISRVDDKPVGVDAEGDADLLAIDILRPAGDPSGRGSSPSPNCPPRYGQPAARRRIHVGEIVSAAHDVVLIRAGDQVGRVVLPQHRPREGRDGHVRSARGRNFGRDLGGGGIVGARFITVNVMS